MINLLRFSLVIIVLVVMLDAAQGESLSHAIITYCLKYRQTIHADDISYQDGIIRLEINSRRTNIKSKIILGFYCIGYALNKSRTPFREVEIAIKYDLKSEQEILIRAPIDKVLNLSQGLISPDQFYDTIASDLVPRPLRTAYSSWG